MNIFPLLGNINKNILGTINSRAGNNLAVSKLVPWIRVASGAGAGLILQSAFKTTFENVYGGSSQSGIVGLDFAGNSVYAPNNERGLRPSPVIESADIQTGHLGLSRKSTFSIKCFTLAQAEKIAQHFLEPGYHVLVEFGWNLPESLRQAAPLSPCEMAKFNIYNYVIDKRNNSNGTYDGFMGQITGGGMTYGEGETYIINVELTTIGEIPAYLQTQKGAVPSNDEDALNKNVTDQKFEISDLERAEASDNIGELLYMQMYNRLPAHKRTEEVKQLRFKPDRFGNPFNSPGNFINVDDKIRQILMENFDTVTDADGNKASIPDGVSLISQESFIRLELAFAIMNTYTLDIESKPGGCGGTRTYSYKIDASNVVIRGHKHMFSTDDKKLYIPNPNLPDFGLASLITAKTEQEISSIADINNTQQGNPWGTNNDYAFPSQTVLSRTDAVFNIPDVPIEKAEQWEWGYLENLYINLDFFIEVLNRSNYVAKDAYYEILNGLSEATNSYWHFEIVEQPDRNRKDKDGKPLPENIKSMKLVVADLSFTGQTSRNNFTAKFDPIGTNTPFLNFNINMDIPAAMRNSILGKRAANGATINVDGKDEQIYTIFNSPEDNVAKILNSFEPKNPTETQPNTETPTQSTGESIQIALEQNSLVGPLFKYLKQRSNEKKVLKANLEAFAQKGILIPLIQDRKLVEGRFTNEDTANIENGDFVVGIYNDVLFLKQVEILLMRGKEVATTGNTDPKQGLNPSILAIEASFDLHGISGLRVGDVFTLSKLPKGYDRPFQIMEINHSLSGNQWITSVKAKMRNM